jgi:alpha-1,3-glucan synthase
VLQSTAIDLHHKDNPTWLQSHGAKRSKSPVLSGFFFKSPTNTAANTPVPGGVTPANQLTDDEESVIESEGIIGAVEIQSTTSGSHDTNLKVADLMAGRKRPNSVIIPKRGESLQAPEIEITSNQQPVKHRVDQKKTLEPYIKSRPTASVVEIGSFTNGDQAFELQKVDQDFTDSKGDYYKLFEKNLEKLNGSTSTNSLCIEEYLIKSERQWYGQYKSAKLGRFSMPGSSTPSATQSATQSIPHSAANSATHSRPAMSDIEGQTEDRVISDSSVSRIDPMEPTDLSMAHVIAKADVDLDHWGLGANYKPPTGLKLFMQLKVGDWPVYTFFMALGQILATSSYQITLISGIVGQTPEKLYAVASIYLVTSVIWWVMYRKLESIYVLSVPFLFYGFAFFLLGLAPYATSPYQRGWIQNAATGMYAIASSSGSIFFALNFGDEGGSTVTSWVFRACMIQGTQQIYVVVLWAWGAYLTQSISSNIVPRSISTNDRVLTRIGIPIAVLFWVVACIMFMGLPGYYRQQPGQVPSFYGSLLRRKIVIWFFVVVIIQNYFLSTLTGRNWAFLWSSHHAKVWQVALLVILFFVFVWAALFWAFGRLSRAHSWILPLFAIGLGAPRWAQILWSTSNIGAYVPWAGSPTGSALLSRALWLWLGNLDAIQGVGFGMILLQTLTRVHIAYTLIAAQAIGSVATIVARATAPDKTGPGDVFPDFSSGAYPGVTKAWFWVALILQLCIPLGFFTFFRKEQLTKP